MHKMHTDWLVQPCSRAGTTELGPVDHRHLRVVNAAQGKRTPMRVKDVRVYIPRTCQIEVKRDSHGNGAWCSKGGGFE